MNPAEKGRYFNKFSAPTPPRGWGHARIFTLPRRVKHGSGRGVIRTRNPLSGRCRPRLYPQGVGRGCKDAKASTTML